MRFVTPVAGVTLLFLAAAFAAGTAPSSSPELQRDADRLIAETRIPAVVALVEQDGERRLVASGLADTNRGRAAQPSDRFWVGSVTKSFVATVVVQLVAEGRLRLDDTLRRRLPGRVRGGRRVRIRHLLNHTSGITDYMRLEPWLSTTARNPRAVIPSRRLVSSAARLPLEFRPGSQASYSNTNYLLLGEIVERVTGQPLGGVLQRRILGPLGLASTEYAVGGRRLDPRQMHGYDLSGPRPRDVSQHTLGGPWADGAIVSNARDLGVFIGALLRGELVPRRLLAQMMVVVPGSHGHGMGIARLGSPCNRHYWGHTGGTPGYVTFAAGTPDARRIVVVSVNGVSASAIEAMGRFLDDLLCR